MVELTVHPAARRPHLAMGLCFGVGLLGSMAWQFLPEPLITLPLLGFLVLSLLPFLAPTRYRLGEALEVTRMGMSTRYSWERFRAFSVDKNGVFLSPYRRKKTEFRGLYLLDRSEELLGFLRQKGLHERAD